MSLPVRAASEVRARAIDWLWLYHLALGQLAMLDGDPGLGKSFVSLDLCARISAGRAFPDGAATAGPANCVIVNAEDGVEDTIVPRLRALGADLERVFVWDCDSLYLRLPSETAALENVLKEKRPVFVVLDPIIAFLDVSVAACSDQSVRNALAPLVRLAREYHCLILLIRHLNKESATRALYRGSGTIGFNGVCRSSWLVGADPHDRERRIFAHFKNNNAPLQASLAFKLEAVRGQESAVKGQVSGVSAEGSGVSGNGALQASRGFKVESPLAVSGAEAGAHGGPSIVAGESGRVAAVTWLGTSAVSADQVLVAPCMSLQARDRACEFLKRLLSLGPRATPEVEAGAREAGISRSTLHRAREDLDIQCIRAWRNGKPTAYWMFEGQVAKPVDGEDDGLEPWLRPLREKYSKG